MTLEERRQAEPWNYAVPETDELSDGKAAKKAASAQSHAEAEQSIAEGQGHGRSR
jgi:hypothetical protein